MTMFNSNSKPQQSKEKQLETLKIQLSEKTNEILRIREENELLRGKLQDRAEAMNDNPFIAREDASNTTINRTSNVSNSMLE